MSFKRYKSYSHRPLSALDEIKEFFRRIVAFVTLLIVLWLVIKFMGYYTQIVQYLMTHTFLAIFIVILTLGVFIFIGILAKKKKQEYYMRLNKFDEILKLNWREFEEFVEAILIDRGFDTILGVGIKDGGVDITAKFEGRNYLIQCKHYNDGKKVTVEQVREFYGVMNHLDTTANGIYVTTGELTKEAYVFARQEDIEVWDKYYFLEILKETNTVKKTNIQIDGNYGICEKCGGKMALRTAHRGLNIGKQFLGCENYPKCLFTKKL